MMELPDVIKDTLKEFQRKRLVQHLIKEVLNLGSISICIIILLSLADAYLKWHDAVRYTFSFLAWCTFVFFFCKNIAIPFLRKENLLKTAQDYEQQFPDQLHNQISSAVSFCLTPQSGVSTWMMQRCIALATQEVQKHGSIISNVMHARKRIGILIVAWATLLLSHPSQSYLLRNSLPWLNIPRPTDVVFIVKPGNIEVASGTDVVLQISTEPIIQDLQCVLNWSDGHIEHIACEQEAIDKKQWKLDLGPSLDSFSYTFTSGEAESPRYHVQVGAAPQIFDSALLATPPNYIRQSTRPVNSGASDILIGSQLQFVARLRNFDVHHATLVGQDNWRLPLHIEDDGDSYTIRGQWQADKTQHYSLHLWNDGGLHHQHPQQWFIRCIQDHAPVVNLSSSFNDFAMSDADDRFDLLVQCEDDFAIESINLRVGNQFETLTDELISIEESATFVRQRIQIDLARWHHNIGDRLWAEIYCKDSAGQTQNSQRVEWFICDEQTAALAENHRIMGNIVDAYRALLEKISLLQKRWNEVESNFRVDDIHARSGDLLLADQQLQKIQQDLEAIHQQLQLLKQPLPDKMNDSLESLVSLSEYGLYHHCHWMHTRGARLMQIKSNDATKLLEHTISDTDLLVQHFIHLNDFAQTLKARIGIDILDTHINLNLQLNEKIFGRYLGEKFWSTPIYNKHLKCLQYTNVKLADKGNNVGNFPVRIKNYAVPNHGNQQYSISWSGEIYLQKAGQWVFNSLADDGIKIRINNQDILKKDAWREQAAARFTSKLSLEQGWQRVDIEYFQGVGDSVLELNLGLEGEKSADINTFQLRSPATSQLHHNTKTLMLSAGSKELPQWNFISNATQHILDTPLYIHDWASNLSLPQLHRVAQDFAKQTKPLLYISKLNSDTVSIYDLKKYRKPSFQNQINSVRNNLIQQLKQWQLPIKRTLAFDDLLIHVQQMRSLSDSLKDWGLSYEYITRSHRHLKRLKDQAIVLYQRTTNQFSQISSDPLLSYGERLCAWEMNHHLRHDVFDKILKINLDNSEFLWRIPDLQKRLSDIYFVSNNWRLFMSNQHKLKIAFAQEWIEKHKTQLSAWHHYRKILSDIAPNTSDSQIKQLFAKWKSFNTKTPANSVQSLEQFINSLKKSSVIDGHDLKHLWQLALLESEHAFRFHKRGQAEAALYLALKLQEQLKLKESNVKNLKKILGSAHKILKYKQGPHKDAIEEISNSQDTHLKSAKAIFDQSALLPDNKVDYLNAINSYPNIHHQNLNIIHWDESQKVLQTLSQSGTDISPVFSQHTKNISSTGTNAWGLHRMLSASVENNALQQVRWKSLAKDIKKFIENEQQNESNSFSSESQLSIFCDEQATITRNRFVNQALENKQSLAMLFDLLSLRDAYHSYNHQFLKNIKSTAAKTLSNMEKCTRFLSLSSSEALKNDQLYKLWMALEKELKDSRSILYDLKHKKYNEWKRIHQQAFRVLKKYWSQHKKRSELLTSLSTQNRCALQHLLAALDSIHVDILIHIHKQLHSHFPDSNSWKEIGSIVNIMVPDLSMRYSFINDNMRHYLELHKTTHVQQYNDMQGLQFLNQTQRVRDLILTDSDDAEYIKSLKHEASKLSDHAFSEACRLLHQQGRDVHIPLDNIEHQQLFVEQEQSESNEERIEQQWQHAKTLIELRAQYEDFDNFNIDQQTLIFNYFDSLLSVQE